MAIGAIIEKSKFNKLLGKRIKQIREKKGMSLKDFETKDGAIDRHALSRIETGQTTPSAYTLYKISHILEVDLRDLCEL